MCLSAIAFNILSLRWRRPIFCLRRRLNLALSPLTEDIILSPASGRLTAIVELRDHAPYANSVHIATSESSNQPQWCPFRKIKGCGLKKLIVRVFRVHTSLAFQGNFSIAKAQRAVRVSSRSRPSVYPASIDSAQLLRDRKVIEGICHQSYSKEVALR